MTHTFSARKQAFVLRQTQPTPTVTRANFPFPFLSQSFAFGSFEMADEELLEGLDDYVDPAETEQETAGKKEAVQ